ncbi:hypothetical protein RRG08_050748 [Elysia crispata]|uniref:Coilin tudor domain-containing protein n=1 Tax=Elysia crispata TaxID=231223 RepID=A0AAE0ZRZ5_9GAST|nr:hypothetical protein RRG08_050748 [Elysia crispata]
MAAPYEHDSVRIRVNFADSKGLKSLELRQRWTLFFLSECPTIKDIEHKLVTDLRRELNHPIRNWSNDGQTKLQDSLAPELSEKSEESKSKVRSRSRSRFQPELPRFCEIFLNGFWLPSHESSRILRDGDEVEIKTSSTPLNLNQTFDDDDERRKTKSEKLKKSSSNEAYDRDQVETILVEEKPGKAKRQKETSEKHIPQEGDIPTEKLISKERLSFESPAIKRDRNDEDILALDQDNIYGQLSSRKKHKRKRDFSFETIHHTKITATPSFDVVEKNSKPASPWSEGGRQYLQSLIKDRIGELTSQSNGQICKGAQVTPPVEHKFISKAENNSKQNLQSALSKNVSPLVPESCLQRDIQVLDKVTGHQLSHLDLQQEREGLSHLLVDKRKFAFERNEKPHDIQTHETAGDVVAKRKRRRKRKSNRNKETSTQPVDLDQSHTKSERDYNLKLPQHLQPPQNNRLIFDDDEDADEDDKCLNTVIDCEKNNFEKSLSQSALFTSHSNNKSFVLNMQPSNQQELIVSPANQNLSKCLRSVQGVGHVSPSGGSDTFFKYTESKEYGVITSDRKNVSYNKVESVVPKLSSFVSADDRFASLLGSTKRLPSSVKISPVVIPRQQVNSAENKDTHATNGSLRNYSTEAKTNGHEMHLETSTVIQESKQQPQAPQETLCPATSNEFEALSTSSLAEVSVKKQPALPSRRDIEEGLKPWPKITWPRHSNIDNLPDLKKPPKQGDILMYKVLELSEDYCPTLSGYKKALVLEVDMSDDPAQLELLMFEAEKKRQGRFELELDVEQGSGDDDPGNFDRSRYLTTVSWSDLVEAKLVSET